MPAIAKKPTKRTPLRSTLKGKPADATEVIRRIGNEWARHWNAADADSIAALYADEAVYLPPHHVAVHGREAIREYLRTPLTHGVCNLGFTVTYIKQLGTMAWDVGTYSMMVPQSDGTSKEDRGKYLSVWKHTGKGWRIVADAWSSDLAASA